MRTTQERLTLRSNVCSAASALLPLCSAIEPTTLTPTEKKKHLIGTQTGSSFVALRKVFKIFLCMCI